VTIMEGMGEHRLSQAGTDLARPMAATKSEALISKSETNSNHQKFNVKNKLQHLTKKGLASIITSESSIKNNKLQDCSTGRQGQQKNLRSPPPFSRG
jgi:hypothetical protein